MARRVEINLAETTTDADLIATAEALLQVPAVAQHFLDASPQDGLSKALKPGGPAHQGRTPEQVIADRVNARARAQIERQAFVGRMTELKDSWVSTVAMGDAAAHKMGGKTSEQHVRQVRRTIERVGGQDIHHTLSTLMKLGKEYGGNFQAFTKDEAAQLLILVHHLSPYVSNMWADIDAGTYRMDLGRRCAMHGNAAYGAFWLGYLMADASPSRWLSWKFSPMAEHCGDCPKLARGGRWGNGIYNANELLQAGLFPRCSKLACFSQCGCSFVPVTKPTSPGRGTPLADMVLDGPNHHQAFHGMGRENRQHLHDKVKRHTLNWTKRKR